MTPKPQASVDAVFNDYEEAIQDYLAERFGEKYLGNGFTTPTKLAKQQLKQLILGAKPKIPRLGTDVNVGFEMGIDQFEASINQLFEGGL